MSVLLQVDKLVKHYRLPREHLLARPALVPALQGLSFALHAGRSLGVVGESGSGKSTLARLVMALEAPTAGSVRLGGQDLQALDAAALRRARVDFQMVFQDPFGSLDPRQTVARIVGEPLAAQGGLLGKGGAPRSTSASLRCSKRWACALPMPTSTRTSSPAASASASPSRARW